MKMRLLRDEYAICKINDVASVNFADDYVFVSKTKTGLDLVCRQSMVPTDCDTYEENWRMFCLDGTLTYTLMGILGKIASILGNNNIGVYVISTHDNIYYLVRAAQLDAAIVVLEEKGYFFKR